MTISRGYQRIALLSATLLLSSLLFSFSASANGDVKYEMFVFYKYGDYKVGDKAEFEIHVFYLDEYVELDELNVTIAPYGEERWLEIDVAQAKVAKGIYRFSFTIKESDVNDIFDEVDLDILGLISAGRADDIEIGREVEIDIDTGDQPEGIDVEVEMSPANPKPGDKVTFTVTFTNGTKKQDPNNVTHVEVDFETPDDYEWGNLTMLTKKSTGVYTIEYTIPANLTEEGSVDLEVDWDTDDYDWDWDSAGAYIKFYDMWFHTTTFTASKLKGEVWVADLNGKGVADLEIEGEYYYDTKEGRNGGNEGEFNGTTDAQGKLDVEIDLTNFDKDDVDLEFILDGDYMAYKDGDVDFPGDQPFEPDELWGWGFEINVQEEYKFEKNKQTSLDYIAYYEEEPVKNTDLYTYIVNDDYESQGDPTVIAYQKVTTDSKGAFTVPFKIPNAACGDYELMVKANLTINGTYKGWRSDWDYLDCEFVEMSDFPIQVSNFGLGKEVTISGTKKGIGEGGSIGMIAPIGDRTSFDLFNDELGEDHWKHFDDEAFFNGDLVDGKGTVKILLPEFLPKSNYIIMLVLIGEDDAFFNTIIVDHKGKTVGGDGDDDSPAPGLLVAVILVALVARIHRRWK